MYLFKYVFQGCFASHFFDRQSVDLVFVNFLDHSMAEFHRMHIYRK